jgi:hypothetical protein
MDRPGEKVLLAYLLVRCASKLLLATKEYQEVIRRLISSKRFLREYTETGGFHYLVLAALSDSL